MGIAKKIIVKRTFKDYISNLDNQNSKIKFEIGPAAAIAAAFFG